MRSDLLTVIATALTLATSEARPTVITSLTAESFLVKRAIPCTNSTVKTTQTYTGATYKGTEVLLRISNGGAGQSGLVGALASAFVDYEVSNNTKSPFAVDWITGDTTNSIGYLASGDADIAITYNQQAEWRAGNLSISVQREYGFRDHFYLVGPLGNPADLQTNDSVLDVFNKIVTTGDAQNGTRFLSRFDKSATNIKESLLFSLIGQIPWALPISRWYHQYPLFPHQALVAAALLGEYTLTDKGTFLTLQAENKNLTDQMLVYKKGEDDDPDDMLLNPGSFLLGAKVCDDHQEIARDFMSWIVGVEAQRIVAGYKQQGLNETLYSSAPNCTETPRPLACNGWP